MTDNSPQLIPRSKTRDLIYNLNRYYSNNDIGKDFPFYIKFENRNQPSIIPQEVLLKKIAILAFVLSLLFTSLVYANQQDGRVRLIPQDAVSGDFLKVLEEGVNSGRISSMEGDYYFLDKFVAEYKKFDKQFKMFRMFDVEVPNLVILADVTWKLGSQIPSAIDTGCGFVFRNNDDSRIDEPDSFMHAQLVMEGKDFFWGLHEGKFVSYGRKYFANPSANSITRKIAIFANGEDVSVLLDGRELRRNTNVAVTTPGMIHYTVQSGTDKGFGTRCFFENISLFVPDGRMSEEMEKISIAPSGSPAEDGTKKRPVVEPIRLPVIEETEPASSGPLWLPPGIFPRPPEGCPPGAWFNETWGGCSY